MTDRLYSTAEQGDCPVCSARPGQECQTPDGEPRWPHRKRSRVLRLRADNARLRARNRQLLKFIREQPCKPWCARWGPEASFNSGDATPSRCPRCVALGEDDRR